MKTKAPKVMKTKAPKSGKGMDAKAPKAGKGMASAKRYALRDISEIEVEEVQRTSSEFVSHLSTSTVREHQIFEKCGSTSHDRSSSIMNVLSSLSLQETLMNLTTAEHQAYKWIDELDELIVCAHTRGKVVQRYIVALIYFAMNGDEWLNCRAASSDIQGNCEENERWLDKSHECEWFGIRCDSTGKYSATDSIASINLKKNNLQGAIPTELFLLSDLMALTLANNKFISGSIPSSVSSLTKLTLLDFSNNALSGSLPESIYAMTSLRSINVASNRIAGIVSENISNLQHLSVLQLNNNELSGPVPATGLSALEDLSKFPVYHFFNILHQSI